MIRVITPPATTPIDLDEAKAHLRVDHDDDDEIITSIIKAATSHAEEFTGRAFIERTLELALDSFPDDEIRIPYPPLIDVTSIIYDDEDGNAQTLDPDSYTVDDRREPGWVVVSDTWPATFDGINSVRIRFRAGYVTSESPATENVPFDVKAAIKLLVGALYENREQIVLDKSVVELPWGVHALLRPHRVLLGMA